jgi:hypothetical protein
MKNGIEAALDQMKQVPIHHTVIWSNMNTKASDYQAVIHMAHEQHRPVHFVIYYDDDSDDDEENEHHEYDKNRVHSRIDSIIKNQDHDNLHHVVHDDTNEKTRRHI